MTTIFRIALCVGIVSFWLADGISQDVEIELINASFEDIPHRGGTPGDPGIRGWYDCGRLRFEGETPPDIHPINAWQVTKTAAEGYTYLGMVVRDNDTWESVAQRLDQPIQAGSCYSFTVDLARSPYYISGSKRTKSLQNYTEPAVLRIWGGTGVCGQQVLLGESVTVANKEWRQYEFKFEPDRTVNYLTLEAFYKTPTLIPYNGHLLVDHASVIAEIPCDEEAQPFAIESTPQSAEPAPRKEITKTPEKTAPTPVAELLDVAEENEPVAIVEPEAQPEPVVPSTKNTIPGLDRDNYELDEIIRVNSITFAMDNHQILKSSKNALQEIYEFLERNKNIVVEIGGHTNTVPRPQYCDELSSRRAKEVAKYLASLGISKKRLYYKGYGKRKPLVINEGNDMEARKKNQRVEIKILQVDYTG
ncbi:MAG: OmpA family protein [Bacteroidota bacterium]